MYRKLLDSKRGGGKFLLVALQYLIYTRAMRKLVQGRTLRVSTTISHPCLSSQVIWRDFKETAEIQNTESKKT